MISKVYFERLLLENSIFFRLSSPSSCNSSWWAIPTLDRRASLQESRFSNCTIFKLPRYGQFYLTFIPGHSQVTLESSHVPIKNFKSLYKTPMCYIQIKAMEQYFHMVQFVFQYFSNRNWVIFFSTWVVLGGEGFVKSRLNCRLSESSPMKCLFRCSFLHIVHLMCLSTQIY